jgi:hypothetical protein
MIKMKINIIKDSKGKILAAFEEYEDGPILRPKMPDAYVTEQRDVENIDDLKSLYKKKNSKH